ncbi:putative alpha-1,6-mannosyltransferase mnn11 [Knufia peltigerae]|uniref:Alpha-1,6-mannosyltransferase mnn11 n=1 Tax=Knufia peltigerae TaxID=1002370 RepID=A0AA39D328_9EURO|nr:putative alpha-1,6-mannosyltransferase mnn11 [Knufia peltigerae]
MQFAIPPRKTSQPPLYARTNASASAAYKRRRQLQLLGYIVLGLLTFYLTLSFCFSGWSEDAEDGSAVIEGHQDVVLVTIFDSKTMSDDYMKIVKVNREDYAARHGYKTFYTDVSGYSKLVDPAPSSWTVIPALRHALTDHRSSEWFWQLSADALITNPALSLESHVLQPLESLMLKDIPVVPPDSVIHTFSHLRPSRTHLILSQDMDNLAHTSFLLRNTPFTPSTPDNWAQYLLDAWFDPLYRAYSFQKAENHALEHIVQWHPTILAKLVLIEQRRFNSYNYATPPVRNGDGNLRTHDSMWQEGDFVVNLKGCRENDKRNCEEEMRHYLAMWEKEIEKLDGKAPAHDVGPAQPKPQPKEEKSPRNPAAAA